MRMKRLSTQSFLTEEQVRHAYKVYRDAELSTYDLGRLLYEQLGYCSPRMCANSLRRQFKSRGWELRSLSEARKLALRKRGFAVGKEARKEKRYERYEREMGRPHQPRCGATTLQGTDCQHPAAIGSDFCAFHRGPPPDEKRCHGIVGRGPNEGKRCRRLSRPGTDYCQKHEHLALAEAA